MKRPAGGRSQTRCKSIGIFPTVFLDNYLGPGQDAPTTFVNFLEIPNPRVNAGQKAAQDANQPGCQRIVVSVSSTIGRSAFPREMR